MDTVLEAGMGVHLVEAQLRLHAQPASTEQVSERGSVCVCERESEREKASVNESECVCGVCVCVSVCEREREWD